MCLSSLLKTMAFHDHFSKRAGIYAQYRPGYPKKLFEAILTQTRGRQRAWDCATGSGQAAIHLADAFEEVIATDGSDSQLKYAISHPRIFYQKELAEQTSFPDNHFDLITVAQALHWLKLPEFYREVNRVARTDATFAAWTYGLFTINSRIDDIIHHFYNDVVGAFWPERRKHVMDGYQKLDFPYMRLEPAEIEMEAAWNLNQVEGYLSSWSASKNYAEKNQQEAISTIHQHLLKEWGSPSTRYTVSWKVSLLIGKIGK